MSIHDACAALRKLAFGPFRKVCEQVFARQQFEHCVSQEFEPLVVLHRRTRERYILSPGRAKFRHRRTVRQRSVQQARVAELVAEPLLQLPVFPAGHFLSPHASWSRAAYFGALNCVAASFLASSMLPLQVACNPPGIAAHFVNAATASSKCDAFWLEMPKR